MRKYTQTIYITHPHLDTFLQNLAVPQFSHIQFQFKDLMLFITFYNRAKPTSQIFGKRILLLSYFTYKSESLPQIYSPGQLPLFFSIIVNVISPHRPIISAQSFNIFKHAFITAIYSYFPRFNRVQSSHNPPNYQSP